VLGRPRNSKVRALLSSAAVGVALASAFTRVWLGVHWLTDAPAGLAMGWAWFEPPRKAPRQP
jgi:membrane-associated phospholipid phosphatase